MPRDRTAVCEAKPESNGDVTLAKPIAKATKKVALLGKAPSSLMEAPFNDPEWEIWSLSDLVALDTIPRWNRHFEIHDLEHGFTRWSQKYKDWLQNYNGTQPLYIAEPSPLCPGGTVLPERRIREAVGQYITNTVTWMIGLAIADGATHIHLYGIDMAQQGPGIKSEYAHQRPSCEWALGIAKGRGIDVYVHERSDLLKCRNLYGLGKENHAMNIKWKQRQKELEQQLTQARQEKEKWILREHVLLGAMDDMTYWREWVFES